jgi:hypothetical protein
MDTVQEPRPESFQPAPTASGRQRRFPRHYQDFLPNSSTQIPHMPPKPTIARNPIPTPQNHTEKSPTPPPDIREPSVFTTEPDEFGLYRVYTSYPSSNPDDVQDLTDRCDAPGLATVSKPNAPKWWAGFGCNVAELTSNAHKNVFAPFLNATVFRLMSWFYSGSSAKSIAELQSLVNDVLLAPDFKVSDLKDFNAPRELRRLDHKEADSESTSESVRLQNQNGWQESTVKIKLPDEKVCQQEADAPVLEVPGVFHRSLIEIITTALQDDSAKSFHYTPFSQFWRATPESPPERIYSEIYNSDAFIEEDKKIKSLPPEPGPQYEHAVAALMAYSDGTHLAQFGAASLCPLYVSFGNQSKYHRAKPSQFAAHHAAYLPSVRELLYYYFPYLTDHYLASG